MDGDENNLMDTLILNLNERDLCPSFHGIQIQVWEDMLLHGRSWSKSTQWTIYPNLSHTLYFIDHSGVTIPITHICFLVIIVLAWKHD